MRRACVIGWPVEHSRSPLIHRYWLKQYGIDGAYEKEAVRPEDLASFLGSLEQRGYVGANVTLPHKEAALRLAAVADEAARAIGAANTLWLDQAGRLCAGNTDAYGFITNLETEAPSWNEGRRPAIVLGAGGAARAILHGLLSEGAASIVVSNRTRARAEELAKTFGPSVTVADWADRESALDGVGLLVNTTSLGMTGKDTLDLDLAALPADAVVADIVYSPLKTELLAAARARGNRTVDGLGMLLYQAVPGFERWFGVRPKVTSKLRAHIAATLGER
jgi:shikimate dehydrogenase